MQERTLKQYATLSLRIKELEKKKDSLKESILQVMKSEGKNSVESRNYLCTLEQQTREVLDQELLKATYGAATIGKFKRPIAVSIVRVIAKKAGNLC